MSEPITVDVVVMKQHRDFMRVTRFLSALLSSFDDAYSYIVGAKELPSLNEVFSRLC